MQNLGYSTAIWMTSTPATARTSRKNALFKEMYRWIDNSVHLNVNDMFDAALRNTRIEMSPAERRQFYEKHIRHMTLTIDENGNVSIELKRG